MSLPSGVKNEQIKYVIILSEDERLSHIPKELYPVFPNLRSLVIDATTRGNITDVTADDFFTSGGKSNLIGLTIANQKLTIIKHSSFAGLFVLERLDLRSNEIHTIESSAFSDLSKLWYLNLDDNKIKVLHDNALIGLTALKDFNLRYNGIGRIGNSIYTLQSIERLFLGFNRINDIDFAKLAKLPKLKGLDMFEAAVNLTSNVNNITLDESSQSTMGRFAHGVLSTLRTIPEGPQKSQLEILDVACNNLTVEAVLKLARLFPNLKKLNVGENDFENEPETIKQQLQTYPITSESNVLIWGLTDSYRD